MDNNKMLLSLKAITVREVINASSDGQKLLEPPFVVTACGGDESVPIPSPLLTPYAIGVIIGDPTSDPINPIDIYGCAYTVIGIPGAEFDIADSVTDVPDAYPTI
ncbi:hypothetical protein C1645_808920 [Glomus cerebriforme]|uniref:Uncharacterized protein n=1 Tax=Glomus cerebriforme TaxID=658196 RepID=A0A397SCW4_9GLOM|nr:hypothetical protein C1645_808920 [Glomus cerebriforme]